MAEKTKKPASRVYDRGKTMIPIEIRKQIGIEDNDLLVWETQDRSVIIARKAQLIEQ